MREIKFRCICGGKIVGYEKWDDTEWVYSIDGKTWQGGGWLLHTDKEQFTGLRDKNGRGIYQHDILRFCCSDSPDEPPTITKVVFIDGAFIVDGPFENGDLLPIGWALEEIDSGGGYLEIIGNIHENPELLEAKCS